MQTSAHHAASAPDLSIVIVAYNGAALLHNTLRSVLDLTRDITYELIVVDNASPQRDIEQLVQAFPTVRFVFLEHNRGYAAANNVGIKASSGRYVALLNPDTVLHDDLFTMVVRWLDDHPNVGAVGPQLIQSDGEPQPYSYGAAPSPWYMLRRVWGHIRGGYLHRWHGDVPQDVDWVAGTCLVARRTAIAQIGGLDERFFLYWEDVDLGMRLRQAGWWVVFLPTARITHVGGGSVGVHAQGWYDRSLVQLYAKHYGGLLAAGVWWLLRIYRWVQRWNAPRGYPWLKR
jgi:GT2 family glycosyltransferase